MPVVGMHGEYQMLVDMKEEWRVNSQNSEQET